MKIYYIIVWTCAIILTFILFFHTFSFAQESKEESLKNLSNTRDTWEIGPEISYIQYKESGVKDKGMMYGIGGSYAYHNYINLPLNYSHILSLLFLYEVNPLLVLRYAYCLYQKYTHKK